MVTIRGDSEIGNEIFFIFLAQIQGSIPIVTLIHLMHLIRQRRNITRRELKECGLIMVMIVCKSY